MNDTFADVLAINQSIVRFFFISSATYSIQKTTYT